MVTVASVPLRLSNSDSGSPTSVERPITTARRPLVAMSYFSSNRITPSGVQLTSPGRPRTRRPIERSVNPSTSFSAGTRSSTGSGSSPSGSGSWTRMPCTDGSVASSRTTASTSPCEAEAASRVMARDHARLGCLLVLRVDVALRWPVVTDEHRCQADLGRSEIGDTNGEAGHDLVAQCVAIHHDRRHAAHATRPGDPGTSEVQHSTCLLREGDRSKARREARRLSLLNDELSQRRIRAIYPASEWVTAVSPIHSRRVFFSLVCWMNRSASAGESPAACGALR